VTARRLLSPLGLRLAAAFITVAVAAVAVYAVLTITSTRTELADLMLEVHREDAEGAAGAAARAYEAAGSWEDADLTGAVAVAGGVAEGVEQAGWRVRAERGLVLLVERRLVCGR